LPASAKRTFFDLVSTSSFREILLLDAIVRLCSMEKITTKR
jgi:hypothetical protein